jgi:phage tail tube protein FII
MKSQFRSTKLAFAVSSAVLAMGVATSASAADVGGKDGWNVAFDGQVNSFFINAKDDVSHVKEGRIVSGWDPSKFNAHIAAPKSGGLAVTGNFQFASNVSGNAGSGVSGGTGQSGIDIRVLDINIAGDFGSIGIGRSWGIFNSMTTINEYGSGNGVGGLCSASGLSTKNAGLVGAGNCGRIGYGYTWTAFSARVEYDTPNMNGFSARVGLFDPVNPNAAFRTTTPRLEGEVTFATKMFKVWGGALSQKLDAGNSTTASATISGMDVGANVTVAGFGITGAYTNSKGFVGGKEDFANLNCVAGSCDPLKWKQAYVDVSYSVGPAMFGVSTGQGKQDTTNVKNTLNMVYFKYNVTKNLVADVEYDTAVNKTNGVKVLDESHIAVGATYNF